MSFNRFEINQTLLNPVGPRVSALSLLSLSASPTVGSVPPDKHLSLSLSLSSAFPLLVHCPTPLHHARTELRPRATAMPVSSPLYRSARPLPPSPSFLSFPGCPSAFPLFLPRGAAPSSPRPHRPRAHFGRYLVAGAAHIAPTTTSASTFRATARRAAEFHCCHWS
jgi:hypothetical protein